MSEVVFDAAEPQYQGPLTVPGETGRRFAFHFTQDSLGSEPEALPRVRGNYDVDIRALSAAPAPRMFRDVIADKPTEAG